MKEMVNLTREEYEILLQKAALADTLKTENEELKNTNKELNNNFDIEKQCLENNIKELKDELQHVTELYNALKAAKFSRKSEQNKTYEQTSLFDDFENGNKIFVEEEFLGDKADKIKVESYVRNKRNKGEDFVNNIDESKIEREDIHVTINKEGYRDINSDEITKRLIFVPAKVKLIVIHRHIYETIINGERTLVRATGHENPLGKTSISTSFLANIIYEKTVNAQPLYRQESDLNYKGIPISRQYMCYLVVQKSYLLDPIFKALKDYVKNSDVTRSDETPLKVIKGIKKGEETKKDVYIWAFSSGKSYKPATFYEVGDRSRDTLVSFVGDKKRYLHSDGYGAYFNTPNITNVICLTHVRRGFVEVVKAAGKKGNTIAQIFVDKISNIYHEDNKITDKCSDYDLIKQKRNEIIKPLFDDFFKTCRKYYPNVMPKSKLGDALNFAIKNEKYVYNILLDGRLELDNNASERKVKSIVIGRKNWMFAFTENGAKATCNYYSLMQTAIENNLNSAPYLEYLFNEFGLKVIKDVSPYLPWSKEMQEKFGI
jgi:transposase